MPVTCPQCGRPLTSLKQWHYCVRVDVDTLFEGKDDLVVQLFDRLLEVVGLWEGVVFSAAKTSIVFMRSKTFLVVKPMRQALDMHFSLPEPADDDAVYKCVKYGKKWVHYVRLKEERALDKNVIRLIRLAYDE